jgi:hypothetical protein
MTFSRNLSDRDELLDAVPQEVLGKSILPHIPAAASVNPKRLFDALRISHAMTPASLLTPQSQPTAGSI